MTPDEIADKVIEDNRELLKQMAPETAEKYGFSRWITLELAQAVKDRGEALEDLLNVFCLTQKGIKMHPEEISKVKSKAEQSLSEGGGG